MKKNPVTIGLTIIFLLTMFNGLPVNSFATKAEISTEKITGQINDSSDNVLKTYVDYEKSIRQYPIGKSTIILNPNTIIKSEKITIEQEYEGYQGSCVKTQSDSLVTYEFTAPENGLYNIEIDYYPIVGTSNLIERKIMIDGVYPFEEMQNVVFQRIWGNDGDITTDFKGNESRPSQIEIPCWTSYRIADSEGFYSGAFSFYFSAGVHTLTILSQREPMAVGRIKLIPANPVPTYAEVSKNYKYPVAQGTTYSDIIQAESAVAKSDLTLYSIWDRSSPLTQPMDYKAIKLNTIGGSHWQKAGQWIEWKVNVPADGLYRLGFRARQNITSGLPSARKLTIDGNVPFAEAQTLTFSYDSNWQFIVLGNGAEDYLFELSEGDHTLRLEVVLGDMGDIIRQTDKILLSLNQAYREIIVVTGTSPDRFRDYYLEQELPETIKSLKTISEELYHLSERLTKIIGTRSNQNILFDRLALQTSQIAENPEIIAKKLSSFKGNISSLGTWSLDVRKQALELDYIVVMPDKAKEPKGNAGFLSNMMHELKLFFSAFSTDYNNMGDTDSENAITVWVSSGREQATIINQMISRGYTAKTGAGVNVQLVAASTLLPSILSNRSPDVALGIPSANIMDFAARGSLKSLDEFVSRQQLLESYHESALIPLQYSSKQYAIPETQVFPMLFYRKDIMTQLGVEVPDTWDDLYDLLHKLQKNNMEFGMPADIFGYSIFLYQNGGSFYKNNHMSSALDEEVAINTFRTFTNLYISYGLPKAYDFANRFRSGEMPIGIADYSMYNQLTVFAPEINGLWSFSPVIGTKQENGSIDRSTACTVTGAVILNSTEKAQESYRFLDWWTNADTQTDYAREQESIMGSAARYTVANKHAFDKLPWAAEQAATIKDQWKYVKAIPEVPGGYYTSRYVNFAFRATVIQSKNVRDTLLDYTSIINNEISSKRGEFGLKVYGEE